MLTQKTVHHRSVLFDPELGHNVRSNWEAIYCRILRKLNIPYEYEVATFLLKNGRTYTPDIKLRDDLFVEVKGYFNNLSQEKVAEFHTLYPRVSLVIIDATQYYKLRKVYFPQGVRTGLFFHHRKLFYERRQANKGLSKEIPDTVRLDEDVAKILINYYLAEMIGTSYNASLDHNAAIRKLLEEHYGKSMAELLQDYEEKKRKVQ